MFSCGCTHLLLTPWVMSHGMEVTQWLRLSVCEWTTCSSLLSAVVNVNIDPVYSGSEEEEECRVLERGWGTGRPIDRWGNACVGEPVASECPGKTKASSWRKWMQRTRRQEERKSMAAGARLSQWAKGSQGRKQSERSVMEYSWNETNYYFSFGFWWIKKLSESSCCFFLRG